MSSFIYTSTKERGYNIQSAGSIVKFSVPFFPLRKIENLERAFVGSNVVFTTYIYYSEFFSSKVSFGVFSFCMFYPAKNCRKKELHGDNVISAVGKILPTGTLYHLSCGLVYLFFFWLTRVLVLTSSVKYARRFNWNVNKIGTKFIFTLVKFIFLAAKA